MKVTFKVEGLRECQEALKQLPLATSKNVLRRALINAARPIEDSARQEAPKRSGRLSVSIKTGTVLTKRQRKANAKVDGVEVYVGAGPLPQAHLQEFGTAEHPPQPFLRPAVDANGRRVVESFKSEIWAEIKKAAARLERKAARLLAKSKGK